MKEEKKTNNVKQLSLIENNALKQEQSNNIEGEDLSNEVKIITEKNTVSKEKKVIKKDKLATENFSTYSKEQLADLSKMLAKHNDPLYAENYLRQIEPFFNAIKKTELAKAKKKHIQEIGNEEGFSFKKDELTKSFDANSKLIKDRKYVFNKNLRIEQKNNLKKAEDTLEKLRLFVGLEESSASFNKFKEIQKEWKEIGNLPPNQSKTIWANYNALVNRFYDQRSIYFELKELDRKKNYEYKIKICEHAEALKEIKNSKEAINILNNLHHKYKHLGPAPKELEEELWLRFKTASDEIYKKRKDFISDLKIVWLQNLAKKQEIITEMKLFANFSSDSIKEWSSKTKDLLAIQKKWELIGRMPKDRVKEINKEFWSVFKTFFNNKTTFFKKLDIERNENYNAKIALIEKAEALKENTDWLKTANEFKTLQQNWKDIGPVPKKNSHQLYKKFQTTCTFFFDKKRKKLKEEEEKYSQNLQIKKDIISQIKEWAANSENHIEEFKQKLNAFNTVGFVPRKEIDPIKNQFLKATTLFVSNLTDEELKNSLKMEIELGGILGSKNIEKIIYNKEQHIRRKIQTLENDIALWENNLGFFTQSKNADALKKNMDFKIDKNKAKVIALKSQLKVLKSI